MNRIQATSNFAVIASIATLSTFGVTDVEAAVEEVLVNPAKSIYVSPAIASSNGGWIIELEAANSEQMQDRLALIFSELSASQEELGYEFEEALIQNLATLYDD
tara:strand:+ start:393 stop:704 length:312 start_codon:yes stop_codon:yes gene_type:complete